MPHAPRPEPVRRPPAGVPRWLWPPPGAQVTACLLRERTGPDGSVVYDVADGPPPARQHLRALWWLLDEHDRASRPVSACAYEGVVTLEIARTAMPQGRVGHAYALNGGPLGAPGAAAARGILARWVEAALG